MFLIELSHNDPCSFVVFTLIVPLKIMHFLFSETLWNEKGSRLRQNHNHKQWLKSEGNG